MRHFSVALHQAKDYFNQGHSSKQTGAGEEEIPAWACHFFRFFNAVESNPSASAQAAELAADRHIFVNSIMGQQAPLGPHQGTQPVQLCTKTRGVSDRNGSVWCGQQRVGNFEMVTLDENSMRHWLVEDFNDAKIHCLAQHWRTTQQTGTRRQNHHNLSVEMNLPNSRYFDVSNAFQHLGSLTEAVAQAFVNPPPPPPRTMSDVMNDFTISSNQLYVDNRGTFPWVFLFGQMFSTTSLWSKPTLPRLDPAMFYPSSWMAMMSRICFIHIFIWGLYNIYVNIKLKSNSD